MAKVVLKVEGMMCQGCVAAATMALEDVAGVKSVSVSLEGKSASVEYDETLVTLEQLVAALAEVGFKAC